MDEIDVKILACLQYVQQSSDSEAPVRSKRPGRKPTPKR